jgi:CRISPR system Cascade subunit CasC
LAVRTKRLTDELVGRIGKPEEDARPIIEAALAGMGFHVADDRTQYLLFLGEEEIARLGELCRKHWKELAGAVPSDGETRSKKAREQAVPAELREAFRAVLDGGRAADLALFGRMLADLPVKNVDAAAQVAHAISTHRVAVEFDFYTAVDDLRPEEATGADMLGTVEFNSACFYRYANVDVGQLLHNLQHDSELAHRTVRAFLRGSVEAIPSGKQHSMAAQNPPSLVLAVTRPSGLWSLANAFLDPVRPSADGDLVTNSIRALDRHWGELRTMYRADGLKGWWCALGDPHVEHLDQDPLEHIDSVDKLIDHAVGEVAAA